MLTALIVLALLNILLAFTLYKQAHKRDKLLADLRKEYNSANVNLRKMESMLDDARSHKGKIK